MKFHLICLFSLIAFGLPFTVHAAQAPAQLSVAASESFMIAETADAPQSAVKIDEQRLIGRWIRPDGGYTLELKEIKKDGSLKAGYYNPRPINVSKAEISRKEGGLMIVIELRDVNYPGSTYNLRYDPKTDRLVGAYFQAVEKQTYDIEFLRAK